MSWAWIPADRNLYSRFWKIMATNPVGLTTIAALTVTKRRQLRVYEPYLLQIGFIERTPRGRQ